VFAEKGGKTMKANALYCYLVFSPICVSIGCGVTHSMAPPEFLFKTGISGRGKILSVDFVTHDKGEKNCVMMLNGFWMQDLSEIRFPRDFDTSYPFSEIFDGTGLEKKDIKYIQFDLLVGDGEKDSFWLNVNYGKWGSAENPLVRNPRIFIEQETINRPLFPYLLKRGYREEIVKAYVWINDRPSAEQGQTVYWPFYRDKDKLKPAVPVQRVFPSVTLCDPPQIVALKRTMGGHATSVMKWEYEPCDGILVKKFSLFTLTFGKSIDNSWELISENDVTSTSVETNSARVHDNCSALTKSHNWETCGTRTFTFEYANAAVPVSLYACLCASRRLMNSGDGWYRNR
jgi:hypothetical protein